MYTKIIKKWSLASVWALGCALTIAGCNTTGIPSGSAPPAATVSTPTAVAHIVPATPSPRLATAVPTVASTAATATIEPQQVTPNPTEPPAQFTAEPDTQPTEQANSTATSTILPLSERQRIFDQVWDTVDQNYLYPDFHGVDWNAIKTKYEPLAVNAQTSGDFYAAITSMIDELNDGHSRYESPTSAQEEDALDSGNADYVGVGIISSPNGNAQDVIYVFPNSPAEKAGLTRRDRIVAVDGTPFVDPAKESSRVRGPAGTTVVLSVVSPEQPERAVPIVRGRVGGAVVPSSKRLAGDTSLGYLIIPSLSTNDMDKRVEAELNQLISGAPALKGLIIDMRGNGGGFRTILESILGDFTSGQVGTFFSQTRSYPFTVEARPLAASLKDIPVVLLVDQGTESYAEVFSASLQETGRAKIVGVPSAGNTETIYAYDLDDGSRLWCAQEGFKLLDGTNLEGRGVIPDVTVNVNWTAFTEDDDPQILKAMDILASSP